MDTSSHWPPAAETQRVPCLGFRGSESKHSYDLQSKLLKGCYIGGYIGGLPIWTLKGNTKSLDYSSYGSWGPKYMFVVYIQDPSQSMHPWQAGKKPAAHCSW